MILEVCGMEGEAYYAFYFTDCVFPCIIVILHFKLTSYRIIVSVKTYYDILGVSRSSTPEEIKKAFILRSKMMHPDRFSQNSQKAEWELANEMFKELNHAYSILKDPAARRQYDLTIATGYASQNTHSAPPPRQSTPTTRAPRPHPPQQRSSANNDTYGCLVYFFLLGGIWLVCKGCDAINHKAPSAPSNLSTKAGSTIPPRGSSYSSPRLIPTPLPRMVEEKIPRDYPEPENGMVFKNDMPPGGHGSLKIINGCPSHSVVKLVDTLKNASVYVVFVRANSEVSIPKIVDGRYRLLFSSGHGWDDIDGRFKNREGSSEFEDPLVYTTKEVRRVDGVYLVSHRMEVTLNSIRGGNARTDTISTSDFEKY